MDRVGGRPGAQAGRVPLGDPKKAFHMNLTAGSLLPGRVTFVHSEKGALVPDVTAPASPACWLVQCALPVQPYAPALMPGGQDDPTAFLSAFLVCLCLSAGWTSPSAKGAIPGSGLGQSWVRVQGRKPRDAPGERKLPGWSLDDSALGVFPFMVNIQLG